MTKTIELARRAGVIATKIDGLERFAELVRADERARLLEVAVEPTDFSDFVDPVPRYGYTADKVAGAVLKAEQAPCKSCAHSTHNGSTSSYESTCFECRHYYASHFQSKG